MGNSLSQAAHLAWQYLERAATFSTTDASKHEGVSRQSLSEQHRLLCEQLREWMQAAGMQVRMDNGANVIGRYAAKDAQAPVIILGSHQDTVPHGGKYDGMLGIIVPLLMIHHCHEQDISFPFHIDVVAFSDEEGARFKSTLLGSKVLSGTLDREMLEAQDQSGQSVYQALLDFACDPEQIEQDAYASDTVQGFIEVHIEQGPILEQEGLALGVVDAITGIERHELTIYGVAGHAGTVPVPGRQDALLGAAKVIVGVNQLLRADPLLVGVVGSINNSPNGVNVISDHTCLSIELRSPDDQVRGHARQALQQMIRDTLDQDGLTYELHQTYEQSAVQCSAALSRYLERAVAHAGLPVRRLFSGAGHDGLAMHHLCPIAMLFVRCEQGISHNPAENILLKDVELAIQVLLETCQLLAQD